MLKPARNSICNTRTTKVTKNREANIGIESGHFHSERGQIVFCLQLATINIYRNCTV